MYFLMYITFVSSLIILINAYRRPLDDFYDLECDIPLGMTSGAIEDEDIIVSHGANSYTRLNGKRYWWSDKGPFNEEKYIQINFHEITVIKFIDIQAFSTSVTPKSIKVFSTNLTFENTVDFIPYGLAKGVGQKVFYMSKTLENFEFKPAIRARSIRIQFEETDDKGIAIRLELYGCPYWMYAKPLGISNNEVSEKQLTSYSIDVPFNNAQQIRYNYPSKGWYHYVTDLQPGYRANKAWVQIQFKDFQKVVYMSYRTTEYIEDKYNDAFYVQYGEYETDIKVYENHSGSPKKISSPMDPGWLQMHVFWYPLVLKIFRYIPNFNEPGVYIKFELYGTTHLIPDYEWEYGTFFQIWDKTAFTDMLMPPSCQYCYASIIYAIHGHTNRLDYQQTRSAYFPTEEHCLVNPDLCYNGLSVSIKAKVGRTYSVHIVKNQVIPAHQIKTYSKTLDERDLSINNPFFVVIDNLPVLYNSYITLFQLITQAALICEEHADIPVEFELQFFTTPTGKVDSYVDSQKHLLSTRTYTWRLKPIGHDGYYGLTYVNGYDLDNTLQDVVMSKTWKYNDRLLIKFKMIDNAGTDCKLEKHQTFIYNVAYIPQCSKPIITDPIDKLPPEFFTNSEIKISQNGWPAMKNTYVTINLKNYLCINALKVYGSGTGTYGTASWFVITYALEPSTWFNMKLSSQALYRYETQSKDYEYISLPKPIYARYLKVQGSSQYEGEVALMRLDVVQCSTKTEPDNVRWIKLNKDEYCLKEWKMIVQNIDVSKLMLVHKRGNLPCGDDRYWGCHSSVDDIGIHAYTYVAGVYSALTQESRFKLPNQSSKDRTLIIPLLRSPIYLFMNDWFHVKYPGNLDDPLCFDVYGYGTSAPRHRLTQSLSCSQSCSSLDKDNQGHLNYKKESNEIFYYNLQRELIHANTKACFDEELNENSDCPKITWLENSGEFLLDDAKGILTPLYHDITRGEATLDYENLDDKWIQRYHHFSPIDETEYIFSEATIKIHTEKVTYDQAVANCLSLYQGHLISLRTSELWESLKNFFLTNGHNFQMYYFIGLRRTSLFNNYRWEDEGDFLNKGGFHAFVQQSDDCALAIDNGWHTNPCNSLWPYICYKPPVDDDLSTIFHSNNRPILNQPLLSSGLQVVNGQHKGLGFQFSITAGLVHVSLQTKTKLYEMKGPTMILNQYKMMSFIWNKQTDTFTVYYDHMEVGETSGVTISSYETWPERYSNFITLGTYFDYSFNHRDMAYSDISIWKYALRNDDLTTLRKSDAELNLNGYHIPTQASFSRIRSGCLDFAKDGEPLCMDVSQMKENLDKKLDDVTYLRKRVYSHGMYNPVGKTCFGNGSSYDLANTNKKYFSYFIFTNLTIPKQSTVVKSWINLLSSSSHTNSKRLEIINLPHSIDYERLCPNYTNPSLYNIHPIIWNAPAMGPNEFWNSSDITTLLQDYIDHHDYMPGMDFVVAIYAKQSVSDRSRRAYLMETYLNIQYLVKDTPTSIPSVETIDQIKIDPITSSWYILRKNSVYVKKSSDNSLQDVWELYCQGTDTLKIFLGLDGVVYGIPGLKSLYKCIEGAWIKISLEKDCIDIVTQKDNTFVYIDTDFKLVCNNGNDDKIHKQIAYSTSEDLIYSYNDRTFSTFDTRCNPISNTSYATTQYDVTSFFVSKQGVLFAIMESKLYMLLHNNVWENIVVDKEVIYCDEFDISTVVCVDHGNNVTTYTIDNVSTYESLYIDAFHHITDANPIDCTSDQTLVKKTSSTSNYHLLTFSLPFNRYSTIRKAFIRFFFTNFEYNNQNSITLKITTLHINSSLSDFSNCQLPTMQDFGITLSKTWEINDISSNSSHNTRSLTELIQAIPNIKWKYKSTITFLIFVDSEDDDGDKTLFYDSAKTSLEIYYDDYSPNNYLWLAPATNSTLLSTNIFDLVVTPTKDSCIEFWLYMSGRDCGLITMWIDYKQYNPALRDLVRWFAVGDQGKTWKKYAINVASYSNRQYRAIFHYKHFGRRCNAAIDKLSVTNEHLDEAFPESDYNALNNKDLYAYKTELELIGLPAPSFMVFSGYTGESYRKDYGPFSKDLTGVSTWQWRIYDKYGLPSEASKPGFHPNAKTSWLTTSLSKVINEAPFSMLFDLQAERVDDNDIFRICNDVCEKHFIALTIVDKKFVFTVFKDDEQIDDSTILFPDDPVVVKKWYYVAVICEAKTISIYFDNVLVHVIVVSSSFFTPYPSTLYLYRTPLKKDENARHPFGGLGCFRVYNQVFDINLIKANEVCPTHQYYRFHPTKCKQGLNVLYQKECLCEHDVRYHLDSCENALPHAMLFKDALFYYSFDVTVKDKSEIGEMLLAFDDTHYTDGPINSALCNKLNNAKTIGAFTNKCFTEFENCENGFILNFWIMISNYEDMENQPVFKFGHLVLMIKNGEVYGINTIIKWKTLCGEIQIPFAAFTYLSIVIKDTEIQAYVNGNFTILSNDLCSSEISDVDSNNGDGSSLIIGTNICLDEISIIKYKNEIKIDEYYSQLIHGEISNMAEDVHRSTLEIVLTITTNDLPKNTYEVLSKEPYSEEGELLLMLISQMLNYTLDGNVNNNTETSFIGIHLNQLKSESENTPLAINVTLKLKYFTCAQRLLLDNQTITHDLREYYVSFGGYFLKVSAIPPEVEIIAWNSTELKVTVRSAEDKEQLRYHYGYEIFVNSTNIITGNVTSKTYHFSTGSDYLYLENLPVMNAHDVTVSALTHSGCGPSVITKELRTLSEVNHIAPTLISCENISHTSLNVSWMKYPSEHLGSENLTFRIYYKSVEDDDFTYNVNLSLYDFINKTEELKHFSYFESSEIWYLTLHELEAFTNYSVLVTTINDMGIGGYSQIFCRTDEWVPEVSPSNIKISLQTSNVALVEWSHIPHDIEVFNSWKLGGYNVTVTPVYSKLSKILKEPLVLTTFYDNMESNMTVLPPLDHFALFQVSIAAFNIKGIGIHRNACFALGQSDPMESPKTFNLTDADKTLLYFDIGFIYRINENSIILYYELKFTSISWPDSIHINQTQYIEHTKQDWKFWNKMLNVTMNCLDINKVPPKSSKVINYQLENLHPYTEYEMNVTACYEDGCSPNYTTRYFKTKEAIPTCIIQNISLVNSSSTCLELNWTNANPYCLHGELRGYHAILIETSYDGINEITKDIIPNNAYVDFSYNASILFCNLKKFWNYTLLVYVENNIGTGELSNPITFITEQDIPDEPPTNIDFQIFDDLTLMLNITKPKFEERNGIIIGYEINFQNNLPENQTVIVNITDDAGDRNSFTVENLKGFKEYEFTVSAFTSIGVGPPSEKYNFFSPESAPSKPPSDVNTTEITSTSITLQWKRVPISFTNGYLKYFLLYINGTLANGTQQSISFNKTYSSVQDIYTATIHSYPATMFTFELAGCTKIGCGPNETINVSTNEFTPSGTVNNMNQFNHAEKENLFIEFDLILPMERNGRILAYNVTCEESTLFSNITGYQEKIIFHNETTVSFRGLKNYTWYKIKIAGLTSIGQGPFTEAEYRTAENAPSGSPRIIDAYNISSTGLMIHFQHIDVNYEEGVILGYHLYYIETLLYIDCIITSSCFQMNNLTCEDGDITSCSITHLDLYTNYTVCVSGFTSAGDGPISDCVFVETDTFVDGNWSLWTEWGSCDRSCGRGLETRLRFCINPEPARGGANCTEHDMETRICNDITCPSYYLAEPSVDCDVTCPLVNSSYLCGTRINTKNSKDIFEEAFDGIDYTKHVDIKCVENSDEIYSTSAHPFYNIDTQSCDGYKNVPLSINCTSSITLGSNIRRLCYCIDIETMAYLEWAQWGECDVDCGGGRRHRFRQCIADERYCTNSHDEQDCNTHLCPIDGHWGEWSEFSSCDVSCGYGVEKRIRSCNKPKPQFNGKQCEGGVNTEYKRGCNPQPCPIHGGWSELIWEPSCSQPCGKGGRKRAVRQCINPSPRFGGNDCSGSENIEEVCNEQIQCREVDINIKQRLPEEQWNYKMVYPGTPEFNEMSNKFVEQFKDEVENIEQVKHKFKSIDMIEMERGSVILNFTISFYEIPLSELIAIQDLSDRIGQIGNIPVQPVIVITQDVPEAKPVFTASSTSEDTITMFWNDVVSNSDSIHGEFYVYYVFYRRVSTYGSPEWKSIGTTNTSLNIRFLEPYTQYGLRMLVSNTYGNGVATEELIVTTLSGRPFIQPPNLDFSLLNSKTAFLYWERIADNFVPGILLGYKIRYRKYNGTIDVDESEFDVLYNPVSLLQRTLFGLKPYQSYLVEVAGYTSGGLGPWSDVQFITPADAPSACPTNTSFSDKAYGNAIHLSWQNILKEHQNGIIRGFKITYKLIHLGIVDILYARQYTIKVDAQTFQYTLTNLQPYGDYEISLLGFTNEGDGPACTKVARTCKCPAKIYSNFYQHEPYMKVNRLNKSDVSGLFPLFLTDILKEICNDCQSYNVPDIIYNRTSTGQHPDKLSEHNLKKSFSPNEQLNFPIFGRSIMKRINGEYPYIVIAESKGTALIAKDIKVQVFGIWNILMTIASTWPLIVVLVLIATIFGWFFWFAEQTSLNSDLAIDRSFAGSLHGLWIAVVTMTTVGYGDFTPSTKLSQIIMIIWTFVGLISVSLLMAVISTGMQAGSAISDYTLYNTKASVINKTFEHQMAIRRNAKINEKNVYNSSSVLFLLDSIKDGDVEIGLISVLLAAEYEDEINERDLKIAKVIDSKVGVGLALSGGLQALEDDLKSYVVSKKTEILDFIAKRTNDIHPKFSTIQLVILPIDEAYELFIQFGILFSILFALGLIYTLVRKCRKNTKVDIAEKPFNSINLFEDCSEIVNRFCVGFQTNVSTMESKHLNEIQSLGHLQTRFKRFLEQSGFDSKTIQKGLEKNRQKAIRKITRSRKETAYVVK